MIAAERALKRKDFVTAFGLANEALATYADNPRMLAARAVSAWNLGEHRVTIADTTRVLQALEGGNPVMHPMLVARAAASRDSGRCADALRDSEKAIALFPKSGRGYLERAIAKEGLHDASASALADYQRAAELDASFTPDYERALARLAPERSAKDSPPGSKQEPGAAASLFAAVTGLSAAAGSSTAAFLMMAASLVGLVAVGGYFTRKRQQH